MSQEKKIKMGPYTVYAERLDKVLFPASGITKGDLINYYEKIADVILPYLRNRPLSLHRFPDGLKGEDFYQKKVPDYFPSWIDTLAVKVKEDGQIQRQVLCQNKATLIYLANKATITPHTWLSRSDKLEYPDKLIFDLDPTDEGFEPVRDAAWVLKDVLDEVGLRSFPMTTGSKGLHLVIPLDRSQDFDAVREFARKVAELAASRDSKHLTTETRKDKRNGRVFLDYLRNSYAQTSVPPYAVRAREGAPVATPLTWDGLKDRDINSRSYNIFNIQRRLRQRGDPWKGFAKHAFSLSTRREELENIRNR